MKKFVFLILFSLVIVSSVFAADKAGLGSLCTGKDDEVNAWVAAQMFIESKLKAPSTAKFPTGPWSSGEGKCVNYGNGTYFILSYVDSQNSYGAMIRSWFSIVVTHTGGDQWKASNIQWLKK